jgi:glycosyltransferase involved in cell wall biosynthesis
MRLVIDLQGAQGSSYARGIGRYSRELAMAMARNPRGHEVMIALNAAFPETAAALTSIFSDVLPRDHIRCWHLPPGFTAPPNTPVRDFAEALRAQFLASLKPDLVHVSSMFEGLGDDVVPLLPSGLERLPVVGTCYDLIPLIRHKQYFQGADTQSVTARWYYRCLQELFLCEGLLAISESSRSEAIDHLSFPPDRIFNIQAGISESFRPANLSLSDRAALLHRYGLRENFILFLGAGDIRKNEAGLIAAYSRLPAAMHQRHQLVIVGKMDPNALRQTAAELHVPVENVVIIPFVPEEDLNALYSSCGVFVFPSKHEGFGLPVAEAMACGAPAIASNTTSLPEVMGREDATFDPEDPASIAASMQRVLENPTFRENLATYGPVQAGRFTWASSASRAWDGLEAIHADRQRRQRVRPVQVLQPRPTLAFVSPLPPQESGIADYSRDLLPSLARYYDITLVNTEETSDLRLHANFPSLSPEELLQQSGRFDRVLYQIGNSHFHRFQIEQLLPNIPGTVVMHDAFLSDYMNWRAHEEGDPDRFRATLLRSHGYPALRYDAEHGRGAVLENFPCSLPVLEAAVGVILHSQYGLAVLREHFGVRAMRDVSIIPLLRTARHLPTRAVARAALSIPEDVFVVCSFGGVVPHKNPVLLRQAWLDAGLEGQLVFAGGVEQGLREQLEKGQDSIRCTGRLTAEQYDLWLAAVDVAVQLRLGSRGESSAAVADALMAGVPTIVNRHGSAAELPEAVVLGLPEHAGAQELAEAMRELSNDPARRRTLGEAGRAYVRQQLSPDVAALRYREAIESAFAGESPVLVARRNAKQLLNLGNLAGGWVSGVQAFSMSFPSPWRGAGHPQLLVDMSELGRRDGASGIQRVVREIARRALEAPPPGWRAEAVRVSNGRLRQTFAAPLRALHHRPLDMIETAVDAGPGDVLLCADINPEMTEEEFTRLQLLRLQGVRIIPVIYDLLPMLHPELFPEAIALLVKRWYTRMLTIADCVACISRAVADELVDWMDDWLDDEPGLRTEPLPISYFHLGADFRPASLGAETSAEVQMALDAAGQRPTVVMTGTVEPRKGYSQALEAFEALWDAGEDVGLTIVGKLGWQMNAFAERLRRSPEMGERLHWLCSCSDAELQHLYRAGSGLLMASNHEGFGLPIIEAAQAGLPVLVRDIPVFREVAGASAAYFSGDGVSDLADALQRWMEDSFSPSPEHLGPLSWDDSYRQLCDVIFGRRDYKVWRPRQG